MPALRSLLDAARWARVLSLLCGALVAALTIAAPSLVPLPAETRLFSPDSQAGGFFGYSSGLDGNVMVIGAFLQDGASPQSGAAYIGKALVVGAGSQAGAAGASVGGAYLYRLVSDR